MIPMRPTPRTAWVLPGAMLLLGLAASLIGAMLLARNVESDAAADFGRNADRVAADVEKRFRLPVYGLRGGAGVYAASQEVTRNEFLAYVESRDLDSEFPGVRGFGFIEQVWRGSLDAFVTETRADGAPNFKVRSLGGADLDNLYVIKYIEPAARNQGALGLDVGSEKRRREGAEQAVTTGKPTLTGVITLVQDQRKTPGFLLYVPVFRPGMPLTTPEDRRRALRGLLYAPIVARELLGDLAASFDGRVAFDIHDESVGQGEADLIFDSREPAKAADRQGQRETERVLYLPGREFKLDIYSTALFDAEHASPVPVLVFIGGAVASFLLAALLFQQGSGRRRAEGLAAAMTADLARLALVAQRTSNAVVITDVQRRIRWVNEGFTRITGFQFDEVIGKVPGHVLQFEGTDPSTVQQLRMALVAEQSFNCELLNRGKDGRQYWLAVEIQPLRDAAGALTGFMAIESDITERKNAEHALAHERQTLANIIEGTNVGTWEWNVETGRIILNERWAEIAGYQLSELGEPTVDTWRGLVHPDDLIEAERELQRHLDGETERYRCEFRQRHKDGHWVWVLAQGKLFSRNSAGEPGWMAGTHMDITSRKLAEADLLDKEAMLDRTGRIAGVGGWSIELPSREVRWTDQTFLLHDLEPGPQPSYEEAGSYFTPESRRLTEQAIERAIRQRSDVDLEVQLHTAKGRQIWLRAVGVLEYEGGRPVRLVGAFQDVTHRHELEQQLRAQNELMNSVLENLPCGLSVFDGQLNLLASNAEFRRLLDLPDRLFEVPVTSFESIIRFNAERGEYGKGEIETLVRTIVERARSSSTEPHRFERVRPTGLPLEVRGGPLPGGGFVTTYTDMSARYRAEAEVKRSAGLLRGAIDAIDEAFVLYDPDDRLVFCNDKYRQIYATSADLIKEGATFEEIVRKGAERGQYKEAEGRIDEWVTERVAAHQAGNTTLVQPLDDGRVLRIVERKMPDGHIVGFRIDITELVRATEAAQEASQSKSRFLANMSHEIRTPMNAILGMLALLRKTSLTPRQADYAAKTEGAARSLLGLLNDILDFSKVEAGKMTLDLHPFRTDQLLRDLSVILSANVGGKPVEVLFDIDPALPSVMIGDAMRLQQVLINLGGNAIKFTGQGEVVISVKVLGSEAATVDLEIAVRDTGIGIAPEHQLQIFSGFTQAEASTTRRFGGTGLGLAICQRLVAMMGGELRLESQPGQGSRFHFSIRLQRPEATGLEQDEVQRALPAGTGPDGAAKRVLVVDDNAFALELFKRMGRTLGWSVEAAASGQAALDLLRERAGQGERFDAVFVDWLMPDLDGWATAQRIRDMALPGGAPLVVMLTAQGRDMLGQRSAHQQQLLDGFLVKPVTASMLRESLAAAGASQDQATPPVVEAGASEQRLAGMRLLLVEDNPNNQQVARELLEDEGAAVQIANHGQEAVEAVAAADPLFDLVLMDLQMPVMDGFTATAQIRNELRLTELPVVAMTANAMASDRAACLAAGMNDHVGKPFDLDELVEVLRRHTHWERVAPRPASEAGAESRKVAAAATTVGKPAPIAVPPGVAFETALARLGGKLAIYRRMLSTFIDDLGASGQELEALLAGQDRDAAVRLMHTVKGVAATLGADAMAAQAAEAEKRLKSGVDEATANIMLAQYREAVSQQTTLLETLLAAIDSSTAGAARPAAAVGAPAALDREALLAALERLAGLLGQADMAAMDEVEALQARFGAALGDRLTALDDAVNGLDFELALTACQRLMETYGR